MKKEIYQPIRPGFPTELMKNKIYLGTIEPGKRAKIEATIRSGQFKIEFQNTMTEYSQVYFIVDTDEHRETLKQHYKALDQYEIDYLKYNIYKNEKETLDLKKQLKAKNVKLNSKCSK